LARSLLSSPPPGPKGCCIWGPSPLVRTTGRFFFFRAAKKLARPPWAVEFVPFFFPHGPAASTFFSRPWRRAVPSLPLPPSTKTRKTRCAFFFSCVADRLLPETGPFSDLDPTIRWVFFSFFFHRPHEAERKRLPLFANDEGPCLFFFSPPPPFPLGRGSSFPFPH